MEKALLFCVFIYGCDRMWQRVCSRAWYSGGKETEDRSGMLEDELEEMEESLLDEFDFRQIDQLSGETELGEKVRFRDLTEMLISGNTKGLGERFLEFFSGQVFSVFQKGRKNCAPAADYSGGCIFLEFYKYLSKQTDSGSGFLYFVSCCDRNLSGSISIDEFICRRKTGELVQLMQVFCPSFFLAVAFTGKSSSALMFYNTILFLIYLWNCLYFTFFYRR